MMKSFIFPVILALFGFTLLSMSVATPTEPEDPIPEEAQKYVHTEVKLADEDDDDDDVEDDGDDDDVPAVGDRIFPRLWCRIKCIPICAANPNGTCVCTKFFFIFPIFSIRLPCA